MNAESQFTMNARSRSNREILTREQTSIAAGNESIGIHPISGANTNHKLGGGEAA
jgi:hypothetical protein